MEAAISDPRSAASLQHLSAEKRIETKSVNNPSAGAAGNFKRVPAQIHTKDLLFVNMTSRR
jgi:hypothetical protein